MISCLRRCFAILLTDFWLVRVISSILELHWTCIYLFTHCVLCIYVYTIIHNHTYIHIQHTYTLADPGLQRRGAKFLQKILNDLFLGVSWKNVCISLKNSIYLQKFLMTFFLVIDLFRVLLCYFFHRGAKSAAYIDTGGQNPYFSTKSQYYHCSFCPGGGPNSIANFDGGAMAGFAPPWIRHCTYMPIYRHIHIHTYLYMHTHT